MIERDDQQTETPDDSTTDASPSQMPALSFRAAQRLAARVAATPLPVEAPPDDAAQQSSEATRAAKRRARQRQQATEEAQHWRQLRLMIFEDIRALREEQEAGLLRSPDLSRAALFATPTPDQVPEEPEWRGNGAFPHPDDRSDAAEVWRLATASRAEALRRRAEVRSARALRPGNTWRRLGSAGERGGKRPGSAAFPTAWGSYLMRNDPDGLYGDGWGSNFGRALKRVEKAYAGMPLWLALWVFTDPRTFRDIAAVQEKLHLKQSQAYRWVDAGARRVLAEWRVIQFGAERSRDELRAAEEAEAGAWQAGYRRPE